MNVEENQPDQSHRQPPPASGPATSKVSQNAPISGNVPKAPSTWSQEEERKKPSAQAKLGRHPLFDEKEMREYFTAMFAQAFTSKGEFVSGKVGDIPIERAEKSRVNTDLRVFTHLSYRITQKQGEPCPRLQWSLKRFPPEGQSEGTLEIPLTSVPFVVPEPGIS